MIKLGRYIPRDTRDIYNEFSRDNFNIILNKVGWKLDKPKKNLEFNTKEVYGSIKGNKIETLLKSINSKVDLVFKHICENKSFVCKDSFLHLSNRLIIGLGNPSPAETGFLLHHIYGVPYIPGSALKGIARWAAIVDIAERIKELESWNKDIYQTFKWVDEWIAKKNYKKEKEKLEEKVGKDIVKDIETARKIFGSQDNAGKVTFFDAFPVGKVNFVIDIMNPHYQEYYGGNKPPADWQNPVPIPFLTVEDTEFRFIIFAYKGKNSEELLKKAWEYLKTALTTYGVGAKTAVGYGYFEEGDSKEKTLNNELETENNNTNVESNNVKGNIDDLRNNIANLNTELPCKDKTKECLEKLKDYEIKGNQIEEVKQIANEVYKNLSDEDKDLAQLLKDIYMKIDAWKSNSKKQKEKNKRIKQILGEVE